MSDDLFSDIETTPSLSLRNDTDDADFDLWNKSNEKRRRIHGFTRLSWLVVLLLAALMMALALQSNLDQTRSEVSQVELLEIKVAGQQVLALESEGMIRDALEKGPISLEDQIKKIVDQSNAGPFETRFGYTILVFETRGGSEAVAALDEVMNLARKLGVKPTETQSRIERLLRSHFESENNDGDPLRAEDSEFLASQLGWVSKLLIYPKNSPSPEREKLIVEAQANAVHGYTFVGIACFMVLIGIGVAGTLAWLATNRLQGRVSDDSRCGPVYIETFAIWFLLFIAVQVLAGVVGASGVAATFLAMLLPLVSLIWPIHRGISFAEMREDIGLTMGNPIVEILCGVVCYIALLPFIVGGLLVVQLLSGLWYQFTAPNEFAPHGVPHPIVRDAMDGDPMWTLIMLLLTTAVAAPLVEELLFRGVLYRHLRDASHHMARWMSVIFSAVINGIVFAAIHPQGLVAIPALALLAIGFSLARQWRGSLIAPMTMHAIHNSIITYTIWRMLL